MTQLDIIAEIITVLSADELLFTPVRTDTLPEGSGIFISLCHEAKKTEFLNGRIIRRNELDFYVKNSALSTELTAVTEIGRLFTDGIDCEGIIASGVAEFPERVSFESGMYVYKIRAWFEYREGE